MHKTKNDMRALIALKIVMAAGNLIVAIVAIIVGARWYLYALGFSNAIIDFVASLCYKIELNAQLKYERYLEEALKTNCLNKDSSI